MHKFRRLAASVAATGLLTLGGLAAAATAASAGTSGSCSARGEFPSCGATAKFESPQAITVTVTTTPDPHGFIAVSWSVVCDSGIRVGYFLDVSPVTKTLEMPSQNPDWCFVQANGVVEHRGGSRGLVTIHISIASSSVIQRSPVHAITAVP